jgi:hypothetical protein
MTTTPTANQLRGRAIGSLFFAGFGALWIGLALTAKEILTVANLTFAALDFVVLVSMAVLLLRKSKRFPSVTEDPRIGRTFNQINGAQWTAGGIVAFILARMHLDAYIPCAITAIVGLHMLPLARLFRYKMHYLTGSVLLVWAALSGILVPREYLQGTSALGTGIILWLSAFLTLSIAFTAARRSSGALATENAA